MNQSSVLFGTAILVTTLLLLGLALAVWEGRGRPYGDDDDEMLDADEWQRRYDKEHGEEWDG